MNDQELDALIAAAGTPRPGRVESLSLGGPAIELRELIMTTTETETTTENDGDGRVLEHRPSTRRSGPERRTRMRRRLAIVGLAAAAATAVTVGLVNTGGTDPARNSSNSAYAEELVAVAEEAPRLLITADGWSITRANEFGAENGELEFTNGDQVVTLFWRPGETHADYLADRAHENDALGDILVAGDRAQLFQYRATDSFAALWIDGDHSVELRWDQSNEADFRTLAATIEEVDVEAWLDAMPASVITPAERDSAVVDVSAGIPVPPGFDMTVFESAGVSDRYQLGAQVTGAVACAWLDIWVDAEASGDPVAMAQAAEAMATSRSWPILLEMDAEGYFPEVLWRYADAVAAGGVSAIGLDVRARDYEPALGCGPGR